MGPTVYFPSERKRAQDFFALKIRRLLPGANSRTWVPKVSTLPQDHRSSSVYVRTVASLCMVDVYVTLKSTKTNWNEMYIIVTRERKLDFRVKFSNTVLFRKSVVNTGIRLYNGELVYIKKTCAILRILREN
jgi:hypothetical protein